MFGDQMRKAGDPVGWSSGGARSRGTSRNDPSAAGWTRLRS